MKLKELVFTLESAPEESLVFAERIDDRFQPESNAVVLKLSEHELHRPTSEIAACRAPGMEYFLEAFLIQGVIDEWRSYNTPSEDKISKILEVIIHYAEHDA